MEVRHHVGATIPPVVGFCQGFTSLSGQVVGFGLRGVGALRADALVFHRPPVGRRHGRAVQIRGATVLSAGAKPKFDDWVCWSALA